MTTEILNLIQNIDFKNRKLYHYSYDNLYCKISFDDEVMYENDFENLECQLFEL